MMSRNRFNGFRFIGILITLGYSLSMPLKASDREGNSGPKYASAKTKEVIERMINAHGGLEKWRKAPTISFDAHLKVNFGGDRWVPFWEEATIETATRRAYAKLPNADGTHGSIAFDGKKAWSAGNLQGIARAPARFTAWRNFYLFNVWEETASVNGLTVPAKYTVYWKSDNSIAVKDGTVSNWSFNKTFDESRMIMPPDGEPDESSPAKM